MRYSAIILTALIIFTGCSAREKPAPLSLAAPLFSEDAELIETAELLLTNNPFRGDADSFSFLCGGFQWEINPDEYGLLFFAVNRTGSEIYDITFNFTYKTKSDFIFRNELIILSREQYGVLENNSAFPVVLIVNGEKWQGFLDGYFSAEYEMQMEITELNYKGD